MRSSVAGVTTVPPVLGCAAGLYRLGLAVRSAAADRGAPRAFVAAIGDDGRADGLKLLRELRRAGISAHMELEGRSIKSQMKRADRLSARVTLIVGGDELARGEVTLRDMRAGEQRAVARTAVVDTVRTMFRE